VLGIVDGKDILCSTKMTASVEEMNKSFCSSHIRQEVKQYKLEKIKKEREQVKNQKTQEKKQKEDEKAAIKKQKEDVKNEKKALKNVNKATKVKNVVTSQTIEIPTFQPESIVNATANEITTVLNPCQTILKSGPRKGQQCGNKALKNCSNCSRHKDLAPVLEPEKPENNII
jgi:hypothetical protein